MSAQIINANKDRRSFLIEITIVLSYFCYPLVAYLVDHIYTFTPNGNA